MDGCGATPLKGSDWAEVGELQSDVTTASENAAVAIHFIGSCRITSPYRPARHCSILNDSRMTALE